jgi:uncharacterized protein (DUF1778 family)
MTADGRATIEDRDIAKLSGTDSARFVTALLKPPSPNARLRAAARRFAKAKARQS